MWFLILRVYISITCIINITAVSNYTVVLALAVCLESLWCFTLRSFGHLSFPPVKYKPLSICTWKKKQKKTHPHCRMLPYSDGAGLVRSGAWFPHCSSIRSSILFSSDHKVLSKATMKSSKQAVVHLLPGRGSERKWPVLVEYCRDTLVRFAF